MATVAGLGGGGGGKSFFYPNGLPILPMPRMPGLGDGCIALAALAAAIGVNTTGGVLSIGEYRLSMSMTPD